MKGLTMQEIKLGDSASFTKTITEADITLFAGYSGASNTGYKQTINEDFISITELDSDTLLAMVADGNGGKNTLFQPAAIVCNQIVNAVKRLYKKDKKIFLKNARNIYTACRLSSTRNPFSRSSCSIRSSVSSLSALTL